MRVVAVGQGGQLFGRRRTRSASCRPEKEKRQVKIVIILSVFPEGKKQKYLKLFGLKRLYDKETKKNSKKF
jgi:hypothetical protein